MSAYVLSCCSTADISREQFQLRDIPFVCFHFYLDGEMYLDDLGDSMPLKDFYQAMMQGADTKTSQVNVDEYMNFFKKFLDQGLDILHVTLSSGISGTYNSAVIAMNQLKEEYPDRKIYIVDSLCASAGYGLFMNYLADLRDEGKTIEEVRDWALQNRLKVQHLVFSTDLTYLIRGGRVSKAAGTFAGILGICPRIIVNSEGKLLPAAKSRSKKRAIKDTFEDMVCRAEGGLNYTGRCYISHADCYDTAKELAQMIDENFKNMSEKVKIFDIGTTIGSHTGPGTVALFFFGEERTLEVK